MSETIIEVERLAKKYQLGSFGYGSLRHDLQAWLARIRGKEDPNAQIGQKSRIDQHGDFWALQDINLEIKRGERVGIIGKNGAGKSTLLKILSRITRPTEGLARMRGRVASLLEVGTGFHPELTGRENVFLNGAIMGMKRRYIQKRFDEIVGYSGVEQFIDTPVKRYSSGMYVRLAFAVAAHLEPDILIVDEVLSVGDSHFQKKCLGKMQDASRGEGRTILFVSHNLNAIATFCDRAILLADGKISFEGNDVARVIDSYQTRELGDSQKYQWKRDSERFDSVYFRPVSLELIDKLGNAINRPIRNNEKVRVRIVFDSTMLDNAFNVGYALYDQLGVLQYMSVTTDGPENEWPKWHAGRNCAFSELPQRLLNEGTYTIELIASLHCTTWLIAPSAEGPSITVSIEGGLSDSPYWLSKRPGALGPVVRWRTEDEE